MIAVSRAEMSSESTSVRSCKAGSMALATSATCCYWRRISWMRQLLCLLVLLCCTVSTVVGQRDTICPPQDIILPCRCSQRGSEIQIWCSHSDLPRVLMGLKAVSKSIIRPIDELILENNFLPSLPGRTFAPLNILRLMLRHNGLERLSNGWLNDLDKSLVEIFIVERNLRSIPVDSLTGLRKLEAVTIQSENLKRLPDFSGLPKLRYINVQSGSLIELAPQYFRDLASLETLHVTGSSSLNRLEAGLFNDLPKLQLINLSENGISWVHLRTFVGLPALKTLQLSGNKITDAGMIGRAVKDIHNLQVLRMDRNMISKLSEGSFVDLPSLKELYLNDNGITEIFHGAFHRTPSLKLVHLENNYLRRVHPESFLQASGSGVEMMHLQQNEIGRVEELRSLLDALPMLRFLDLSHNKLEAIPFGALRGHGTLEQLYLNQNRIRMIERDAFMAMPGLRELRLQNNSLHDQLPMPFWNLPGLKGIDISYNSFRRMDPNLLVGVPSLRRLDISGNTLSVIDAGAFTHTPMLETVNISFNELSLIHSATFRDLNHMFELDAGNNKLQEFIPGLPVAVERVNLHGNMITQLPPPTTASQLWDLPNLRMLDISANQLTRLPRAVFKPTPQLRVLSLARNQLQSVDDGSLSGLSRLEILNLQDNRVLALHERCFSPLENLRELNLQGNRIEVLVDNLLDSNALLEQFDASRNSIVEISPKAFRNSRSLQTLDLSSNQLRELPESLSGLAELRELDVSFNQLTELSPNVLVSWRNLEELKVSNNKVNQLHQGSLRNLPLLQYLDLSSNELTLLEHGSLRNLPELQELVLADNKLSELKERVFEDLPNLQAVHLQQNNLRYISPYSFFRSPSIVYLNLSANQFRSLDSVGLRSVRNLEVLDLTGNSIRKITPSPLRGLDWLVELKLDNNKICGIQGEPFATMPRLRVLSMRNNQMSRVPEPIFRSLRTNIAILDVDGNPLDCSCDMLWYMAWLQESRSLYPGPRCRDGKMLLDMRLSRTDCQSGARTAPSGHQGDHPLTNDHGDVFVRALDYDECAGSENYELPPGPTPPFHAGSPSPGDSDYFYDQYVDYPNALNDTRLANGQRFNNTTPFAQDPQQDRRNYTTNFVDFNNNKFNQFQRPPGGAPPPPPLSPGDQDSGSPFTFFGLPIPSLNIGKMFGGAAGRNANNRASGGSRAKGRVQVYKQGEPEQSTIYRADGGKTESTVTLKAPTDPLDKNAGATNENNLFYRPFFQTSYRQPPSVDVQQGGFTPMLPGAVGGFTPITDPTLKVINQNYTHEPPGKWPTEFNERVPLVTEPTRYLQQNKFEATIKPSHNSAPYFVDGITHHIPGKQDVAVPPPMVPKRPDVSEKLSSAGGSNSTGSGVPHSEMEEEDEEEDDEGEAVDEDEEAAEDDEDIDGKVNAQPGSSHNDHELTTRLSIELATPTIGSTVGGGFNKAFTTPNPTIRELARTPNRPELYDSTSNTPSSLSALIAPGQPHRPPPGKGMVEKVPAPVSSTVTPYFPNTTPGAPHRVVPKIETDAGGGDRHFGSPNIIDLSPSSHHHGGGADSVNEIRKREDMDWYFANYNHTQHYDFDELEINSFRSGAGAMVQRGLLVAPLAVAIHTFVGRVGRIVF
ncbi:protein artichoke [Anopheles arabiensis]|uniref:LRRCT domain-containing protein n=2 Tax=Anopheles gambiae TaxID=7165 RepID=A0A1S4H924_ANOGA|nr:protein artichoke [Anopheles arabiensis]